MKRIGYIYEDIISVKNCKNAIINASRKKEKRKEVSYVLDHLDEYAKDLSKRLIALKFTSPYKKRIIKDGLSGKERELQIPAFYPDQCAHHAIIQILKPIIERSSYAWSCANIPKRGIDKAAKGVERATVRDLRHAKYCLKLDISKFYPSIDHGILKARLKEKIKDRKALEIINVVIDSHNPGLPIGNYTSPWLAEFLLQPLDMMIKQKCGVHHHIRYADDMTLIDNSKKRLRKTLNMIKEWLANKKLTIKYDYQIFKIRLAHSKIGRKIDFVGRCFARSYTTIRKRKALAFMRQSRYMRKLMLKKKNITVHFSSGFMSRSSCLKHTSSYGFKKKYYDTVDIKKVKEIIRTYSLKQLEKAV